ncbi:hypothetical protein AGLY_008138 [Aphis glycines]|uniref:Uncharacterized protein n=1 Tax=Aphis glycines TaxID=307491 RepID=A0A6G0TN85_APHGL|nr:hypothetical protein AGLY_008138 [Aphis glycines]
MNKNCSDLQETFNKQPTELIINYTTQQLQYEILINYKQIIILYDINIDLIRTWIMDILCKTLLTDSNAIRIKFTILYYHDLNVLRRTSNSHRFIKNNNKSPESGRFCEHLVSVDHLRHFCRATLALTDGNKKHQPSGTDRTDYKRNMSDSNSFFECWFQFIKKNFPVFVQDGVHAITYCVNKKFSMENKNKNVLQLDIQFFDTRYLQIDFLNLNEGLTILLKWSARHFFNIQYGITKVHGPFPVIGKTSTLPLTVYCPVISRGLLSTSTFKESITVLVKPMILTSFNFKSMLTALLEPFPCSISKDGSSNGSIAGILSFGYPSAKSGMTDWMEVFKHFSSELYWKNIIHQIKLHEIILITTYINIVVYTKNKNYLRFFGVGAAVTEATTAKNKAHTISNDFAIF